MMDGEKRIVTFMGESGRRTANIIWLEKFGMFKVDCILNDKTTLFKMFMDESKAQQFAEEFVWEKKYAAI
jgi:hypothetical protein